MTTQNKTILRALAGETQPVPPIWMMRQAGRYLPEYRATRAQAGDFLSLCYNSELAAEVTLQPIRRYGFDAAIMFADILLIPQALGADLWFVTGEGPRLSTVTKEADFNRLKPANETDATLNPIYETLRILSRALPAETTLIGFAGAPWTVATYMIAGRGTPDQGPAHKLMTENPDLFQRLIDLLTEATIDYLSKQIDAGAEVVKLFDSWAGSLSPAQFEKWVIAPNAEIVRRLKARNPNAVIIGFPKGAGGKLAAYAEGTGVDALGLDETVDPHWANRELPKGLPVQGNLDPLALIAGGDVLKDAVQNILSAFQDRPHIFNLGHGILPDTPIENVELLLNLVRKA